MKQSLRFLSIMMIVSCTGLLAAPDVNYRMPPSNAVIKGPANARGVDNVDCCDTAADQVTETLSKLCIIDNITETTLDTSIDTESKLCVISSKLDDIDANVDLSAEFDGTFTALDELVSKICVVDENANEIEETSDSMLSKVCVIESVVDNLDVSSDVTEEFTGVYTMIESSISKLCVIDDKTETIVDTSDESISKACVIESKLDNLDVSDTIKEEFDGTFTVIAEATSKACVIDGTMDVIDTTQQDLESKLCIIDSKVNELDVSVTVSAEFAGTVTALDNLLSKVCIVDDQLIDEEPTINEMESKTDIIASLIDTIVESDLDQEFDGTFTLIGEALSKACVIDENSKELETTTDDIESAICAVESRLADQDANVDLSEEFGGTYTALENAISKACVIDEKVTIVDETTDESLSKACVIESKLDNLDISVTVSAEFDGTFTALDAVLSKACLIEDQVDVVTSQLEEIRTEDFDGTFTEIAGIQEKLCAFDSKLDYLFETRLELISEFLTELDALSIDILEAMSVIEILSEKVLTNLSNIDEVLEDVEVKLCDATSKACDIESKVEIIDEQLSLIDTDDFGGTFTMIAELESKVCVVDGNVVVINEVADLSLSKACVIESVIDMLATSLLDFTEEFNETFELLDVSESKLCVIEDKSETLIDSFQDVESKACIFESGLDALDVSLNLKDEFDGTFTVIAELLSKACILDDESVVLDGDTQDVESKVCVIDSKLDVLKDVAISVEQTFAGTFTALEESISKVCVLEDDANVAESASDVMFSKACAVDEAVQMLNVSDDLSEEFNGTFTALANLKSKVCVIEDGVIEFDDTADDSFSKLCVVESKVDALDVSISVTAEFNGTFTALDALKSKLCVIEDDVDVLDSDSGELLTKVCVVESLVDALDVSDDLTSQFDATFTALEELNEKVCAGLCDPTLIDSAPYTISSPGTYIVTADLEVTYGPDSVITIDADNVVLNLCGHTLSGDEDITGIEILADHENITIFNGIIRGVDYAYTLIDTGIKINEGVSRVEIDSVDILDTENDALSIGAGATSDISDIIFKNSHLINGATGIQVGTASAGTISGIVIDNVILESFTTRAIDFTGSSAQNLINSTIKNCTITDNTTAAQTVSLRRCAAITIENCHINNNTTSTNVIELRECTKCCVTDCELGCNTAGRGIFLDVSTTECTVKRCKVDGNTLQAAYEISNDSNNNVFEQCVARRNTNSSDIAGFKVASGSNNNLFEKCEAINNISTYSGIADGFSIANSNCNEFIDCIANNQQGTTSGNGFRFTGTLENELFIRCIALCNQTTGFDTSGATLTDSEFKDCQAMYNGVSGFDLAGADDTVHLFRNIACGNGPY